MGTNRTQTNFPCVPLSPRTRNGTLQVSAHVAGTSLQLPGFDPGRHSHRLVTLFTADPMLAASYASPAARGRPSSSLPYGTMLTCRETAVCVQIVTRSRHRLCNGSVS